MGDTGKGVVRRLPEKDIVSSGKNRYNSLQKEGNFKGISMDARILDMLRQITPEEQAIPDGRRTIGRNADGIVLDALRRQ